tara:strand:+ start:296 stop:463 length:168 start_codon:yes stop_codon:yes gene_type:complete
VEIIIRDNKKEAVRNAMRRYVGGMIIPFYWCGGDASPVVWANIGVAKWRSNNKQK